MNSRLLVTLLTLSTYSAQVYYDYEKCGKTKEKPRHTREAEDDNDDYNDSMQFQVMSEGDSSSSDLPFSVAVVFGRGLCAGTLVSSRHVLTAAHCLIDDPDKCTHFEYQKYVHKVRVVHGGPCLSKGIDHCTASEVGEAYKVSSMTIFPFFENKCIGGSDLAILELEHPLKDAIHACLPHLHRVEPSLNQTFYGFGWGADPSKGFKYHQRMQLMELPARLPSCDGQLGDRQPMDAICLPALGLNSLCAGDSGSGLMATIDGRAFIFGVTSFGSSCSDIVEGMEAQAQVFTDIHLYTASIDKRIGTAMTDILSK